MVPQLPAPPIVSTVLALSDDSPLAWLLQSLSGNPHASAAGSPEGILVGQDYQLFPKSLLQKICNWECSLHPPPRRTFKSTHLRRQGRLILSQTGFRPVIVSKHPSATLELLAYMLTIASQQYDGLNWRSYPIIESLQRCKGTEPGPDFTWTFTPAFLWAEPSQCLPAVFAIASPIWQQTVLRTHESSCITSGKGPFQHLRPGSGPQTSVLSIMQGAPAPLGVGVSTGTLATQPRHVPLQGHIDSGSP